MNNNDDSDNVIIENNKKNIIAQKINISICISINSFEFLIDKY